MFCCYNSATIQKNATMKLHVFTILLVKPNVRRSYFTWDLSSLKSFPRVMCTLPLCKIGAIQEWMRPVADFPSMLSVVWVHFRAMTPRTGRQEKYPSGKNLLQFRKMLPWSFRSDSRVPLWQQLHRTCSSCTFVQTESANQSSQSEDI